MAGYIAAGRLLPVQRDVALKLALRDAGEFKAFIDSQPKGLIELGERGASGDKVNLAELEPTAAEIEAAKSMGVWSPEHRIALIRQKAAQRGVELPADFGKEKVADKK